MKTLDNRQEPNSSHDMTRVSWKAISEISRRFNFSEDEMLILLGNMPAGFYRKGIVTAALPLNEDQLERVSYLLGIMKALLTVFSDERQAYSWINRENSLEPFGGLMPRQFLLEGNLENLQITRRVLDSWTT